MYKGTFGHITDEKGTYVLDYRQEQWVPDEQDNPTFVTYQRFVTFFNWRKDNGYELPRFEPKDKPKYRPKIRREWGRRIVSLT